jgi:hypothetical protein
MRYDKRCSVNNSLMKFCYENILDRMLLVFILTIVIMRWTSNETIVASLTVMIAAGLLVDDKLDGIDEADARSSLETELVILTLFNCSFLWFDVCCVTITG